jgi:hypothetical protein
LAKGSTAFTLKTGNSIHAVIRTTLKLLGLYKRGLKNAEQIQVRHNHVRSKMLPSHFDCFNSSQGPAYSGIQVIALRSYLKPFALLSASLLEFITRDTTCCYPCW